MSHQTVISTKSPTVQKTGQKRAHSNTPKEKTSRKKVSKKPKVTAQQNFTASLGTHRSGNLHGQRFSAPLQGKVSIAGSTATLQRLSSGTFVLSGASGGQVKLQNGNNIVYLQQLTSSGGTTQVIQTPLIANSNGTFSTLSLATCSIPNIVTTASIGAAPTTAITASATASGLVLSTMDLSKTTQSSNLITTSTIPRLSSIESPLPVSVSTTTPKQVPKQITPSPVLETEVTTATTTTTPGATSQSSNVDIETPETLPNLPSSLANLILSLPSVTTSGFSAEANAQAQSILQRLSEEDIKTLVTVLAKSTPNSPASSPALTPDHGRSPIQSPRTPSTPSPLSDFFPPQSSHAGDNKSKLMSIVDTKTSSSSQSPMNTTSNKASHKITSHPLSLTQKVSAMQQDINKLRSPRLKAPRIITTGLSGKIQSPNTSSSSSPSSMSSNKQLHAKTQKVPITITIPISRLPSNLQLTTSNSKTINVPALSAYLAQQKFVLSTGKSSSLDSRTVLLGSSNSNKRIGGIMVSTNSTKGSTVFKTAQKDSSAGKSAATITLHLPSQKETPLKKAASDIKLVGVLNQKNKTQLVSASSIRPSSLPASPKSSPASPSASAGELSPIQPRQVEEAGELEPIKPSSLDDCIDDSDIDFSVIPTGKSSLLSHSHQQQQKHRSSTIRTSFPTSSNIIPSTTTIATMPLAVNSKIIRVPVSSGDRRLFGSKNLMEFNKAKSAENQLMNSARKVGVAFQQVVKNSEVNKQQQLTSNDASNSSRISTNITSSSPGLGSSTANNGKLRFEPLHLPGSSRPNYSAVLSSMSVSDDISSSSGSISSVGSGRNTILAKPTVVNSKAAAMIARTAFITDNKLSNNNNHNRTGGISFSQLNKNMIVGATKTTTPALFSGGGNKSSHQAIGSPLNTPAATIRTAATTSKVLPVTIKSNDFIRMSSQVRNVQPNHTRPILSSLSSSTIIPSSFIQAASSASNNKFIKKETLIKVDPKPQKQQKKAVEVKIPEPKEEPPPPYITRSGRVLRSRYPYADEVERKASPRKRRRNSSTSKEETTPPAVSPVTMNNIGSSLDSLVEAAKLITTNHDATENCVVKQTSSLDMSAPPSSIATGLSHIDSTTNMAATAMLELLASNATILSPAPTVDAPYQDFNRGTNTDTVKPAVVEFVNNAIPKTDVSNPQPAHVIDIKPQENTTPELDVPAPFAPIITSHVNDIHPRFEEVKNENEVVQAMNKVVNDDITPVSTNNDDKIEDCNTEIQINNTDIEKQKTDDGISPQSKEEEVAFPSISAPSISSSTKISEE